MKKGRASMLIIFKFEDFVGTGFTLYLKVDNSD